MTDLVVLLARIIPERELLEKIKESIEDYLLIKDKKKRTEIEINMILFLTKGQTDTDEKVKKFTENSDQFESFTKLHDTKNQKS